MACEQYHHIYMPGLVTSLTSITSDGLEAIAIAARGRIPSCTIHCVVQGTSIELQATLQAALL